MDCRYRLINIMKRLLLTLLILAAATAFKCGSGDGGSGQPPVGNTGRSGITLPDTWVPQQWTAGGVPVVSVVAVPPEALARIDIGIMRQIACYDRVQPSWGVGRQLSEYLVIFIDPMATNQVTEPGSPALIAYGVQTAGTVLGAGRDGYNGPTTIVLPHQAATNWRYLNYLEAAVGNESEHVREWWNSEGTFYNYAIAGDVHPHCN